MKYYSPETEWIGVDVWNTFTESGLVITDAMEPYRKWCIENIGPVGRMPLLWYNDLYNDWSQINFKRPEDAAAFILMSGGRIVDAKI